MIKKRFFDLLMAILFIIIFLPICLFIYLFIYFQIGNPVIFKQDRVGYRGKKFTLFKFRTMNVSLSSTVKDSKIEKKRVLKKMNFLRATKLDEIPQLFNIVKGELSFVGPRPLLAEYTPLYSNNQIKRLHVMPGLTGWSQIKSKKKDSWKKKIRLDLWYIKNQNFLLDLKIIFLTIIFFFKSLYEKNDDVFMSDKFNGKN
jgi:lipopolysaccharide/colanic/teichoic acid biosynthesis glycosyltransferase